MIQESNFGMSGRCIRLDASLRLVGLSVMDCRKVEGIRNPALGKCSECEMKVSRNCFEQGSHLDL
jgi:hypothetical protein